MLIFKPKSHAPNATNATTLGRIEAEAKMVWQRWKFRIKLKLHENFTYWKASFFM